jgi:hypothetical protein
MGNLSKTFVLFLAVMIVTQVLVIAQPALAEIKKLSIPQFTVKFTDNSYDVPASSTIDPYTGKPVTNPTNHVENLTVQFTIKNITGINDFLKYEIQAKGHYSDSWKTVCKVFADTHNQNTILVFVSSGNGVFFNQNGQFTAPVNGTVDFRIQATTVTTQASGGPLIGMVEVVIGQSDWSSIQTLTISSNAQEATPTPTVPEFPPSTILLVLTLLLIGAITFKLRKKLSKTAPNNQINFNL